jgi:4a-hydroxytetrahydrobiopterin dehydratase
MSLADEPVTSAPKCSPREITMLSKEIDGWSVIDDARDNYMVKLEKRFEFPDFATAMVFVNKVGVVAENEGHHPEVTVTWGKATVRWWSHERAGVTRDDFIMAAKTDTVGG